MQDAVSRRLTSKMGIKDPAVRLSCQIQIDEDLKDVVVEIFDNVY